MLPHTRPPAPRSFSWHRAVLALLAVVLAACPTAAPARFTVPARAVSSAAPDPSAREVPLLIVLDEELARSSLWPAMVEDLVAGASETFSPLGIRFRILAVERWESPAQHSDSEALLAALREQIPAPPGALVVGFTARNPLLQSTFDQIGLAYFLGSHALVRSLNTPADFEGFLARNRPRLGTDTQAAYRADLARRTRQVLEHELGHLFGALHSQDSDSWMFPTLRQATTLDACNVGLLRANAGRALGDAPPFPVEEEAAVFARYQACEAVSDDDLEWARVRIEFAFQQAKRPKTPPPPCGYPVRDPDENVAQARCLAKRGEPEPALERLRVVLAQDPSRPDALLLSAYLLSERGDHAGALALLSRGRLSRNPDLLYALGQAYFYNKDETSAVAVLIEALALQADLHPARLFLAVIYLHQHRDQEAIDLLSPVADTAGVPDELHFYLGLAYLKLRRYEPADAAFARYLSTAKDDPARAGQSDHAERVKAASEYREKLAAVLVRKKKR